LRARGIRAPTPSAMTYLTREQIQNEGKGERVWPVAPQILSGDTLRLLQSSLPALQGSSPFSSNRSASSSCSPTNLGRFLPLPLHPRAPGSSSASLPAPAPATALHGHRFLFLSSSFPLLSCFCLCLSARLLARLLVLGSHRVPGTMDRGTTNPERETTFSMHFYTVGTKTFPCSRPGTTVPGTWNAASFPFRYD